MSRIFLVAGGLAIDLERLSGFSLEPRSEGDIRVVFYFDNATVPYQRQAIMSADSCAELLTRLIRVGALSHSMAFADMPRPVREAFARLAQAEGVTLTDYETRWQALLDIDIGPVRAVQSVLATPVRGNTGRGSPMSFARSIEDYIGARGPGTLQEALGVPVPIDPSPPDPPVVPAIMPAPDPAANSRPLTMRRRQGQNGPNNQIADDF